MTTPEVTLNDGRTMPQIGFGVWQLSDADVVGALTTAIAEGYRSVDTARIYENEAGVGRAIARSDVPRSALFVTTKVWNDDHGFDATLRAFDASLGRLGLETVDLYLIHWPAPRQDKFRETWKALVRLRSEGRALSIGVSNFREADLRRIIDDTGVVPAVNQIEVHPRFQQHALRAVHAELGVVTEAWSPLGRAHILDDPTLIHIAARHAATPAQVALAWHLASGIAAIPKSADAGRMRENLAAREITLDAADMAALADLDDPAGRTGPDPDHFPG